MVDESFVGEEPRPSGKGRPKLGNVETDDDPFSDGGDDDHGNARHCGSLLCALRDDGSAVDPSFSRRRRIFCAILQIVIGSVALGVTGAGIVGPILFIRDAARSTSEVKLGGFFKRALPRGGDYGGGGPAAASNLLVTARPSVAPTWEPTRWPTDGPTAWPTLRPTTTPTLSPTVEPTVRPTIKIEVLPECVGRSSLYRLEVTGWDALAMDTAYGKQPYGGREPLAASVTVMTPMLGKRKVVFDTLISEEHGSLAGDYGGGRTAGKFLCLRRKRCYTVVATLTSMAGSDGVFVYNGGSDREPTLEWSVRPVNAKGSGFGDSEVQGIQMQPLTASGLVLPNWVSSDTGDVGGGAKKKKKRRKKRGEKKPNGRKCTFALAPVDPFKKMICQNTCKTKVLEEEQPSISAGRAEKEPLPDCPKRALLHEVVYYDNIGGEELGGPPGNVQLELVMNRPWSKAGEREEPVYRTGMIRDDKLVGSVPSPSRYLCLRPDRCYTATFEGASSPSSLFVKGDVITWVVRKVIRKQTMGVTMTSGIDASLVVASGEARPLAKGLCTFAPSQSKRLTAMPPSCEETCMTLILSDLLS